MENKPKENTDYSFLSEESLEKNFADLNISLLSGKHIQVDDYNVFSVIENYYSDLKFFYINLYKLDLVRDVFDGTCYYYLNFFDSGKGKLNDPLRNKPLTEIQTITGLMLLDMYYQRYFDDHKILHWVDIKQQIVEGDHKQNYQRILFNTTRPSYSEGEWQNVEKKFKDVITSFEKLGWVIKQSGQNEELQFEIKPAIHRMIKLYAQELEDFDSFTQYLKNGDKL